MVPMTIVQFATGVVDDASVFWSADWIWGFPLIVATVVLHVVGMGLITKKAVRAADRIKERSRHPIGIFVLVMSVITWLATTLHGIEAFFWALAFRYLGALPDIRSAMLYSLGAVTSYGHANLSLQQRWQLMGAMEALNGWLLFGLTTAFMFGTIEKIWLNNRETHPQTARESAVASTNR
jgi:hypothetical protein